MTRGIRRLGIALLSAGVIAALSATAGSTAGRKGVSTPEQGAPLPNFDIASSRRDAVLDARPGASQVSGRLPQVNSAITLRFDGITGAANRLYRLDRPLTAPDRREPEQIARTYLARQPSLFGLSPAEVSGLSRIRAYRSDDMGAVHLTYGQSLAGIPVEFSSLKVDLTDSGEILIVSGSAIPRLARTVSSLRPRLNQEEALEAAMRHAGLPVAAAPKVLTRPNGPRAAVTFAAGNGLSAPATVQLSLLAVAPGQTALAWETTLQLAAAPDVYRLLIDAHSGKLLLRYNQTQYAHGSVFTGEGPLKTSPVTGSTPALSRTDVPFDGGGDFNGEDLFEVGDPHFDWWAGLAKTTTESNNVRAGSARGQRDFFPFVPTPINANAGEDFTFGLDLAQAPGTYTNAAISNLFFWNNRLHDIWHRYGFNEASGNFQTNNLGNGGVANDTVLALAQYGADTIHSNNANFSTQADGNRPTMRMFEWTSTDPRRDSDLDTGVIAHEYGHGVSNRLVGNASGLGAFQSRSMGEGWSDFQALMVVAESADNRNLPHTVGAYSFNNVNGIRSQAYSTNVTGAVYTRTFYNIGDAFLFQGTVGQVHNAGEIMGNTMWQVYTRFAGRLGFQEGRDRAMTLFIDALKLSPLQPGFLDFRDALLLADQNRFAGADRNDIWAAFAAHGMGVGASITNSSVSDVVESFKTPSFRISGVVRNTQGFGLNDVQITARGPGVLTREVSEAPSVAIPDNGSIQRTLNVDLAGDVSFVRMPINITHPFRGDLILTLAHGGRSVQMTNVAFFNTDNRDNLTRTFETTLFNGLPAAGDWTLTVRDGSAGDVGTLVSWGLNVGRPVATFSHRLTNNFDGTYALNELGPGTYDVTATKTGFSFAPRQVTLGPDATVDFAPGLEPPLNVKATASATELKITVTWDDGSTTNTGYRIERALDATGGEFKQLVTLGDVAQHVDTAGLEPNRTYRYRVFVRQGKQESLPSASAFATTPLLNGGKIAAPKSLDFKRVKVGTTRDKALKIKNKSRDEDLQVTPGAITAPYAFVDPPGAFVLKPGETRSLAVRFSPTKKGSAPFTLPIRSSDKNRPTLNVKFKGRGR